MKRFSLNNVTLGAGKAISYGITDDINRAIKGMPIKEMTIIANSAQQNYILLTVAQIGNGTYFLTAQNVHTEAITFFPIVTIFYTI